MEKLLIIFSASLLLSTPTFAQTMNIHTATGTDVYNLAEIDSITFEVGTDSVVDYD